MCKFYLLLLAQDHKSLVPVGLESANKVSYRQLQLEQSDSMIATEAADVVRRSYIY